MFCSCCRRELPADARFCLSCGTRQNETTVKGGTMRPQTKVVVFAVIMMFGLLLLAKACVSVFDNYGTTADSQTPEAADSKTLETPLKDIGKKEPQTDEEKAKRICDQAHELEAMGQDVPTELKNSCELLGY